MDRNLYKIKLFIQFIIGFYPVLVYRGKEFFRIFFFFPLDSPPGRALILITVFNNNKAVI